VYLLHVPSEKILARMLRGAIIDIASIGRGANVLSAVLFDLRLVAKYEDARNDFWLNLFSIKSEEKKTTNLLAQFALNLALFNLRKVRHVSILT
jgi:hypothetical protein